MAKPEMVSVSAHTFDTFPAPASFAGGEYVPQFGKYAARR
jgi:hypothetical protein